MYNIRLFLISWLIICSFRPDSAFARLLQILHTNDMHGFFDSTIVDAKAGGYAAVKGYIDEQKLLASKQGIDSLVLDAGDFMEGNIYYMAKEGERTFNMMSLMGYDAIVMGNHDYLMGTDKLEALLSKNKPSFHFLGTNFRVKDESEYPAIHNTVKESVIIERAGVKIGIIGLTTDEVFYSWCFYGGKIGKPIKRAERVAQKLKDEGVDVVIALTHLGVSTDRELAKKTSAIDIIVGGHSHTALFEPLFEANLEGKQIPIVQAGSHGKFLGRLLLEVDEDNNIQVKEYGLMPVNKSERYLDQSILKFASESRDMLYEKYGQGWLNDVVGETRIPLINSDTILTPWTAFISDSLKEAVDADIAFHTPNFTGAGLPIGTVTREKLFNSYPRVFKFENKFGWPIYKAKVKGVYIKNILQAAIKFGMVVSFSGVTFEMEREDDSLLDYNSIEDDFGAPNNTLLDPISLSEEYHITNIRINGEKVYKFRDYSVAIPAGIIRGGRGIVGDVTDYIFKHAEKTDKTVWMALEEKFRKVKVIDKDYVSELMGSTKSIELDTQIPLDPRRAPPVQEVSIVNGRTFVRAASAPTENCLQ